MKYKVGDRVIGISEHADGRNIKGKKGTVISVKSDKSICVEFDEDINGHNDNGKGKNNHCWWVNGLAHVELINEGKKKIVITSDGNETLARLYDGNKVIKSATAKCSPEDTFDFSEGAKIAFDRLVEETKSEEEWRVVDRPAKVGDYIRLKTASFSFSRCGDILKAESVNGRGLVMVSGKNHPRPTGGQNHLWSYLDFEYEVVEPATKKEEPKYYNGKVV